MGKGKKKVLTSSMVCSYPARIIRAAFKLAAHFWWTFPEIAVGGPRTGKLPWKGSAFLTAEGSSRSSLAMSSPAYKIGDFFNFCQNWLFHTSVLDIVYLHCLTFWQFKVDNSRSRWKKRHTHLHNLNLCIRCVSINMTTIQNQIPQQLAWCLRYQLGWIVIILDINKD